MDNTKLSKIDIINKSVSITYDLYANVKRDRLNRIVSLEQPFDNIILRESKKLTDLNFLVNISIIGSSYKENDIFSQGIDKLYVDMIMQKCTTDEKERLSTELCQIEVDLKNGVTNIKGSNFPKIYKSTSVVDIDKIDISEFKNPFGEYLIYFEVRDTEERVKNSNRVVKGAGTLTVS